MPATILEGKSHEELLDLAKTYRWWHAIDLRGYVTPGVRSQLVERAFAQIDFRGRKVLDIGCWDGLWSFEAEERGASAVYSTDYVSLRSWSEQPTYQLAHKARGSRAAYYPNLSVNDVGRLGITDFDVVLYCGIYYHLRDPLRALTALRDVMAEGGLIVVEGPVMEGTGEVCAEFFGREWFAEDPTNWWVPTVPCLREWLDCSFFDVVTEISARRDLSVDPGLPVVRPAAARARPSALGRAGRATRAFLDALRGKERVPEQGPPTRTFDRYLVIARATSVSERLARGLSGAGAPPLRADASITGEMVAGFCAAAAEFRERRPWSHVRSDVTIKVESASLGSQPLFLLVLGEGRGLAAYFDRGWLTMSLQGSLAGERTTWAPLIAVLFHRETDLPGGEAAALRDAGWSSADDAYPFAVWNQAHAEKTGRMGSTLRRPDAGQLQFLEACCRALPGFIEKRSDGGPAVERIQVPVAGGALDLTLSWMTEGGREL